MDDVAYSIERLRSGFKGLTINVVDERRWYKGLKENNKFSNPLITVPSGKRRASRRNVTKDEADDDDGDDEGSPLVEAAEVVAPSVVVTEAVAQSVVVAEAVDASVVVAEAVDASVAVAEVVAPLIVVAGEAALTGVTTVVVSISSPAAWSISIFHAIRICFKALENPLS